MNQSNADEPPADAIGVDLPCSERRRLADVDALLRAVAARDRQDAIVLGEMQADARSRAASGGVRSCATC
ncbi:MAG TPA: hypothetical protein VFU64_08990 [Gaiellaceae bacterium]|nr:hypothetical protein [Gaiellaceae bacterium]